MNPQDVTIRVAVDRDRSFLKELFFEVRSPEFAPANLDEQSLRQLLAQQFEAMRTHYAKVFPDAVYSVFEYAETPIGYQVVRQGEEIHLIDIALKTEFHNQGIGTAKMKLLMEDADKAGKPLILSVEIFNPAKRLYERLGFEPYEDFGMYKRMRWNPVPTQPLEERLCEV